MGGLSLKEGSDGSRPDHSNSVGSGWGVELGAGGPVQIRPCGLGRRREEVRRGQPVLVAIAGVVALTAIGSLD